MAISPFEVPCPTFTAYRPAISANPRLSAPGVLFANPTVPPPPATGIGFRVATGANPPSGALRNGDSIRFHPRIGHGARMVGGVFEGSTDGFSYTVLYAITQSPPNGWTEVGVNFDAAILSIASGLPLTQVFGAGARYPILAKFAGLDSVSTALAKHGPMKFPICLNAL